MKSVEEALRVVVDTNVWIDYLFCQDEEYAKIIKPIFVKECNREIQFVVCEQTVRELNKKIKDICTKLKYTKDQIFYITSQVSCVLARSHHVYVEESIPRYCVHHHDDVFIQCAVDGNARCVISSDAHLSNLPENTKYLYRLQIDLMDPLDFAKDCELMLKIHSYSKLQNIGNIRISSKSGMRP